MKTVWFKVINEPLVLFAIVIASLNATTEQTWQGYAVAVITALLRFVVTGPFTTTNAEGNVDG